MTRVDYTTLAIVSSVSYSSRFQACSHVTVAKEAVTVTTWYMAWPIPQRRRTN